MSHKIICSMCNDVRELRESELEVYFVGDNVVVDVRPCSCLLEKQASDLAQKYHKYDALAPFTYYDCGSKAPQRIRETCKNDDHPCVMCTLEEIKVATELDDDPNFTIPIPIVRANMSI